MPSASDEPASASNASSSPSRFSKSFLGNAFNRSRNWVRLMISSSAAQGLKPFLAGTQNGHIAPGFGLEFGQSVVLQPLPKLSRLFSSFARVGNFASLIGS